MTTLTCGPYRAELVTLAAVPPPTDTRTPPYPEDGDGTYLRVTCGRFLADYVPVRLNAEGEFDEATVARIERHFPLADAELSG